MVLTHTQNVLGDFRYLVIRFSIFCKCNSAIGNTCKISCNIKQYERRGDESREEQNKGPKNHYKKVLGGVFKLLLLSLSFCVQGLTDYCNLLPFPSILSDLLDLQTPRQKINSSI